MNNIYGILKKNIFRVLACLICDMSLDAEDVSNMAHAWIPHKILE